MEEIGLLMDALKLLFRIYSWIKDKCKTKPAQHIEIKNNKGTVIIIQK